MSIASARIDGRGGGDCLAAKITTGEVDGYVCTDSRPPCTDPAKARSVVRRAHGTQPCDIAIIVRVTHCASPLRMVINSRRRSLLVLG